MFPARAMAVLGGDEFRDEYSLAFDGSDEYIDCGNISTILDDALGTISLWVKSTATGSIDIMLAGSDDGDGSSDLTISKNASEKLWIFVRNDGGSNLLTFTSTASLVQNAWYHIVFAVGSSSNAIYIDGTLAAGTYGNGDNTTQKWFSDVTGADSFVIGARQDASSFELPWQGNISEVAYYDKQLSASEVATIYNGREPYNHKEGIAVSNLKGWWRMGDGTESGGGSVIYDMSANSNNGTMTNMEAADFSGDTP